MVPPAKRSIPWAGEGCSGDVLSFHRFLFILLGPPKVKAYHEVGRAMATLLTDEVSLAQHPWMGWAWNGDTRTPLLCRLQRRAEDGASWWPPLPRIRKQKLGWVCRM